MDRAFASAVALCLAVSARAQTRVELAAPEAARAGVSAAPQGFVPAALSASVFAAPSAPSLNPSLGVAPSLRASLPAAPAAAAALPAPPTAAAAVPGAAQPAPAALAGAQSAPDDEEAEDADEHAVMPRTGWRLPRSSEGDAWRFREGAYSSGRLWDGSREIKRLGAGVMGAVFPHPARSGSIVKVARLDYAGMSGMYMSEDEAALTYEDEALSRMADLGAAPRPLARLTISGRPASERERIYGSTVWQMKLDGRFGPRERALVLDMLARIARSGGVATDLNLDNIMIGRREGDREDRAWLVDTLGITASDAPDGAGRVAEMLARSTPWIAHHGFGLGRPLSRALDGAMRVEGSIFAAGRAPLPWPKTLRHAILAVLLGALAVAPALGHAVFPSDIHSLGRLPSWPAFAEIAAVLGIVNIPVSLFAHRLAPWIMTKHGALGEEVLFKRPLPAFFDLAFGAAVEEALFRGFLFIFAAAVLLALLPTVAAIAAASFATSFVFARMHGYGSVWSRVVGGLIYAGAFVVSGTFLLPIAAHFSFNAALYVYGRYFK